jgi:type II secretory pathway pseudopilin PulG
MSTCEGMPLRCLRDSDRGSMLLCALLVIALIATVGVALSLVVSTESVTAANYDSAQQALYAADAAIERAIADVRMLSTWSALPAPSSATTAVDFNDRQSIATAPDGFILNLVQLTLKWQSESDAVYPNTPDRPVWRLYAHAPLSSVAPGAPNAAPYVVVWVADDADDLDGDAAVDTNDVVMLHAEAFAVRAGKRSANVTIHREQAIDAGLPGAMRTDVRVIAWHEVR